MNCPHCGTDTPAGAARCGKCGAPRQPTAAAGVLTPVPDTSAFQTIDSTTPAPSSTPATSQPPDETMSPTILPGASSQTRGGTRQMPILADGHSFGPRYHIIRMLGIGGMGAVYHAWDAELGVAVALKVIRADVTADPEAALAIERRFKRELLLARQVTHKHVVRIHDLGDVDGVKYITMTYVQGADLASVLRQSQRLPIPRALTYARQIAGGLVAAHEAGVVHRDLKPANIMIDEEDQALIMDFGIARSSTTTEHEATGVVGTLAYMAPEQARGQAVDQRADVYALGMMLHEMLVGRRTATGGEDAVAELRQRMQEAPPRVSTIDSTIPEPLDSVIARCVEPDADQRYQSSAELLAALSALDGEGHLLPTPKAVSPWRLAAAGVVLVLAIAIAAIVVKRTGPAAPPQAIQPVSVLVADFENKTGDAVFDGALEQPLTIAMEGASFVTTYPRKDAQEVARTVQNSAHLDAQTARLVAFREGIKYVLAGSVTSSGGGFTLRLDAIDPVAGKVTRSATASAASKSDVLGAVGTLAATVRAGIGDTTPQRSQAETFTAASFDAMREYSQAQDLQGGNDDAALAHYLRAIELDPKFGRAYSGAATVTDRLGRRDEAEALWKQSLSLLDRMTEREKYRTLGAYYLAIPQNYDKAIENYTALVDKYPADDSGHSNLALARFYTLDFPKALEEGKRAVDLFPRDVTTRNNLALYAMYAGDFPRGAAEAKVVIARQPLRKAYLPIAMAAIAANDLAAAVSAYNDMEKVSARGATLASIGRADLALYAGRIADAQAELQKGIAADQAAGFVSDAAQKRAALAEAYAATGKNAQAAKAAANAIALQRQLPILVPAARVLLRVGQVAGARAIATELERQLQKQSRAYAKIIRAEIALEENKVAEAADLLGQARQLADVWLARFDLGIAYVQAGHFAEAVTELEACDKRRGEATALFFDDVPTVRYLAPLSYWLGRAQEGLNMAAPAKAQYERFLVLKKAAAGDPLVEDARRRVAGR